MDPLTAIEWFGITVAGVIGLFVPRPAFGVLLLIALWARVGFWGAVFLVLYIIVASVVCYLDFVGLDD